mgnify:CR=1 FL=1
MYRVTLPEGIIDYARNIPSRELILVAPAANLAVSSELHPALVDLLIQFAAEIPVGGGVFEEPDAFPSATFIDLPLNAEAQRFYGYGPPFLQRYLPFWLATLVDRLKVADPVDRLTDPGLPPLSAALQMASAVKDLSLVHRAAGYRSLQSKRL